MHRSLWLVVVALATGCGGTSGQTRQTRMSPRDIIDASSPAIVRIEVGDPGSESIKVGTGFIVDKSGLVATNLHVIRGESNIRVTLYKDPNAYPATVVAGVDEGHDLALLRIKPKQGLPVVRLGDSNAVSAGDRIYAIGNPLGFDYSITDGLISQVRPVSDDLTILQISAAISQGSSGGPLFNQYGEVIGVTTAIITTGQAINVAVPANYLLPMMKQQIALSLDDFAKATREPPRDRSRDAERIERKIPHHPVAVWTGCDARELEDVAHSIGDAIEIGAPLYNQGTEAGFEACFRVYEGTALRFQRDAPCRGVGGAFGDGLSRAKSLATYKEKAWALRDTFDGLLEVVIRCKQDSRCVKKLGKSGPGPSDDKPDPDRKK